MEWNEWISRRRQQHGGRSNVRELRSGLEEEKEKSCEFRGGSRSIPKPSFKTQFNFLEFSTLSPSTRFECTCCVFERWVRRHCRIFQIPKFHLQPFLFTEKLGEGRQRGCANPQHFHPFAAYTILQLDSALNEQWGVRFEMMKTQQSCRHDWEYERRDEKYEKRKKLEFHQADKDSCEKESNSPKPKFQIDTQQLNGISL